MSHCLRRLSPLSAPSSAFVGRGGWLVFPEVPIRLPGERGGGRSTTVCLPLVSLVASRSQLLTWSVWFPFAALIARCSSRCGVGVGFLRRPPRADEQVTQLRTCARAFKSGGGAAEGFGGFESRGGGGAAEAARRQQLAAAREACEAFCANVPAPPATTAPPSTATRGGGGDGAAAATVAALAGGALDKKGAKAIVG